MEPIFHLRFLGTVQIEQDDEPVRGFESRKALALLGYLAAQGHPIPREQLVALFWGDKSESRGRANLSWVLNRIATLLPGCLQADRHAVRFQRADSNWLDIDAFGQLEVRRDLDSLTSAVALYRGEFLEGLSLDGCAEFELWLVGERERWRQRAAQALETLVAHHDQRGEWEEGLRFARCLLALEPWREETHCQVMRLLTRSGQRSAALAQYETCRRVLADELGIEPLPETTALYERIKAAEALRHDLPAQPTRFLGRQKELADTVRLLNDPDCRLLTILGPGGVGKTRLALQAAETRREAFLEGIHFVPLAAQSSDDFLVSAIADALQFSLSRSGDPQAQLVDYLRKKEVLLILDNYEHLLPARDKAEGAKMLSELLENAPEVRLLVTSRERLNMRWERCYEIAGLDYPDETASEIESNDYSAMQLFEQAARQVRQDMALSEQDKPTVAHICRLVEGLPLGIELAASWAGTHTCQEIAAEIEQGLDFLATSLRDAPQRHRSIQATFEHSWHLLTPPEQDALMTLSIFRGGFQRKAAEQVTGVTPIIVKSLVDKSLLRCLSSGRCEMHRLLRQYAAEKLAAQPEMEARARDLHCAYYTTFLKAQESDLSRKRAAEALAAVKQEIANVRAAWRWAVQEAKLEDIERGLTSLSRYYLLTGPFQEGSTLIGQAVDRVRALGDQGEQTKREVGPGLSRLLAEQARLLNQQGMYEQAIAAAQAAVDQAQISQAIDPEAMGHLQWGRALWYLGDYAAAQSQFESALNLAQSATLQPVKAKSLRYLGNLSEHQSDYARARACFEQALRISQEIGDQQEEGRMLNGLGLVALNQDDYTQAKTYYEQALRTSRELGDRWLESLVLSNLGNIYSSKRDFARARDYFEQGLHIQRNLGDLRSESMGLLNLGLISNRQGDFAKARTYYEQSLRIQRDLGDRRNECAVLSNLGLLSHRQSDYVAAQEYSRQALQLAQELGDHFLQGFALTHLGHALTGLEQLNEAATAYREAMDIRHELGQHNLAIESLAGLVRVSLAQGELVHAQRQAEEILAHLETGNLDSTIEPLWIYLTCYQVLTVNNDPRAQEILSTAHRLLQEQAAKIGDEEVQRSFLENVAAHREIVTAFKSQSGEPARPSEEL